MSRLAGGEIIGGRHYVVGEQGTDAVIPSSRIIALTPVLCGGASSSVVIKMENIREQRSELELHGDGHILEESWHQRKRG